MHAPFTDGFHHPTCNGTWTKRENRGYVCAQWSRKISGAGPVLLVRASSILRATEEESQSELWACSVAAVDCLQGILKPWTWIGVQPPQFLFQESFMAGNIGEEEKQRRFCLVSSEKCWVIPWQFLGISCTHLPNHSHPAKQGGECELLLSLYPFISPYSLTSWGCEPQGLPTLMHPLSFSLFLVLCPNLKFSVDLLMRSGVMIQDSLAPCLLRAILPG